MLRVTLKGLVAHKLRVAATALAVTLGVAFMAGTLVLTDTIGKTFEDLFADVYAGTDAVVRGEAAFGDGQGRARVEASLVDEVAAVDGVAAAEGTVQGYAQLVDKEGEPIGDPGMGAPTFGGSWSDVPGLNPFTLVDGRPPAADGEVVIDKASADRAGYAVGDRATVLVQGPPVEVTITGIARFGSADSPAGASYVLFNPEAAQRLVAAPGRLDAIAVVAAPGVSQAEVVERIGAELPDGVEVLTGEAITAESQSEMQENLSFFSTFLLVFAVVALLVGSFIIFNTFSITVAQRTQENALLRAIGASRRQVLTSVLLEALVVGVLASIVGLVTGIAVAVGLQALLAGLGIDIPAAGIVLAPRTVVLSLVVGVAVTVVAGGVVLAGGVASLLAGLFGDVGNAPSIVGLGVLLVFFGVSILGRTVSLPLSRAIGAPLPRLRGIAGALARANAMRNPKRTAATASALMIGVGLVAFITILAASTRTSIRATMEATFTGDFAIDSGTYGFGGLDPGLARRLDDLSEVETATGVRMGTAQVAGDTVQVLGVDPATAFDVIDVQPTAGTPADLADDGIAVFEEVAAREGWEVGDRVTVHFAERGSRELTVAMLYGENQPVGSYLIALEVYEASFADQYDFMVLIDKADGVGADEALAAIEQVTAAYPGADVRDRATFVEEQTAFVDQILGLVYALLALAIVIALLGISNTLALSVLERTRELGLLRSVGMTRPQLRSTVRWESVIIALQGTALGLAVGVFFGWALVRSLTDEGIDHFHVPVGNLAVVVVLAGIAGVVAAIVPARRAARLDVLRAITTE